LELIKIFFATKGLWLLGALPRLRLSVSCSYAAFLFLFIFQAASAEPWINTENLSLRSDIEILSDIGVIRVPITTYPLMWAGIIKDIDNTDIQEVPATYKTVYWRVKKSGKAALLNKSKRLLTAFVASSEQTFRSFGDSVRGKAVLTASSTNLNKRFAWNMQVNRVSNPLDGDSFNYDGSYVAAIWGDWIASVGKVEKWWGASWDSANLLSNNARPPVGLTLNRNYSNASELSVIKWLGPWSLTGFISQLEDTRRFERPILSGISFSFKPLDSIEASLRATAISGGTTEHYRLNFDAKILTAFDLRWRLPVPSVPVSFYLSLMDEGIENKFSTSLFGLSGNINVFDNNWRVFVETTETFPGGVSEYNRTYEDRVYANGYRLNQRAIGSTYDNDSQVTSLGLIGNLSQYQSFSAKFQSLKINLKEHPSFLDSRHTINQDFVDAIRFVVKWQMQLDRNNQIDVELDYSDKVIDGFGRQDGQYRLAVGLRYYL